MRYSRLYCNTLLSFIVPLVRLDDGRPTLHRIGLEYSGGEGRLKCCKRFPGGQFFGHPLKSLVLPRKVLVLPATRQLYSTIYISL
jgi:hypothetical protein